MLNRAYPLAPPAALSPVEAATYTGLSRQTIDRLRKSGRLASCKVGGRVVIRRATLDAFLEEAEDGSAHPDEPTRDE